MKFLNRFSMYRLVLYYLIGIFLVAFFLSIFKVISYSPGFLILSLLILVISGYLFNLMFSNLFDAPINPESNLITSLILVLIITPVYNNIYSIGFLVMASLIAQASKYLLTYKDKHIFNPAALAVLILDLLAHQTASWWVGSLYLTPFVLIGGLIILRKISNIKMVASFIFTNLVLTTIIGLFNHDLVLSLKDTILISPLLFLAFVMLTEPLTSPRKQNQQLIYAFIVAVLLLPQVHLFSLYTTPEIALIIANFYAFWVNAKDKLFLYLQKIIKLSSDQFELVFDRPNNFNFMPGQYMEWTLSHDNFDQKGVRRYFTISSSPTEDKLSLAYKNSNSSYKKALAELNEPLLIASSLGGDFILPNDSNQKLVFIAGGIGITPFRSMIKYLIDTKQSRDIYLLYFCSDCQDFVYKDLFEQAKKTINLKVWYICSSSKKSTINFNHQLISNQRLSINLIKDLIKDYDQRLFLLAGSDAIVKHSKQILRKLGLRSHQIKTDHFSGY